MYQKFSRDTEENIHSELSEINWDLAMKYCGDNADAGFSEFFNTVNKIVNNHAPLRPLSERKAKQFSKPWITRGIRKSIKVKKILYLHLEIMKNINTIAIKYLHLFAAARSRTIIHISIIK